VVMHKRALLALLLCVGVLSLAALACTSDQEWIIPRTETPTPTHTPVPMNVDTQFHTGDTIRIVGNAFQVWQTTLPEADRRNNRVIGTQCFPGQTAPIVDVAEGPDGLIYYKVTCILDGWVPETNVEPVS
jgi:hypothetical protein